MKFTWDIEKEKRNIEKHGLGFMIAKYLFSDPYRVDNIDDRKEYGEERHNLFAKAFDVIFMMCYVLRGDSVRIISLRRANQRERRKYYGKDS